MPRRRSQSIRTFLQAAGGDLVEQYFLRLFRREQLPPYLIGMTPDCVFFLLDRLDEPLQTVIREDLDRINDVSDKKMGLPYLVAHQFDVPVRPGEKSESVAMRLFLEHSHAFNLAWALYSYRASSADISQHWLQRSNVHLEKAITSSFTEEVQAYFASQDRGLECRVSFYELGDEVVVLVLHGSAERTIPCWQGHEVAPNRFRPACEDVLSYDRQRAVLSVKVSRRGDAEYYVRSFAGLMLGDAALADDPERDQVYTLEPLYTGRFDGAGNGKVIGVEVLGWKTKRPGRSDTVIADDGDGLRAIAEVTEGTLIEVKFRFSIRDGGKEEKVTFTISPPSVTDMVKKRHDDVITQYLREKGVLLR